MENKKPVLLIDQDDVLVEYIKAVTERFNSKYHTSFSTEDCVSWDLISIFGENIVNVMHEPQLFRELEPVTDAIETFKRLYDSNLFEMYIVTAAKPCAVEPKFEWFKEYMPFLPERNIIISSAKDMIKGDYLFDDGMHNIEAFANAGGVPIIFNRPHNYGTDSKYKRVDGWLAFEEYIMSTCYPQLVQTYFEQDNRRAI